MSTIIRTKDIVRVNTDGRLGEVQAIDDHPLGTPPAVLCGILVKMDNEDMSHWFTEDSLTVIRHQVE